MSWPNNLEWSALRNGVQTIEGEEREYRTVECGKLILPSGRLVICDPFSTLKKRNNASIAVAPGKYPVVVTVDMSVNREAYATLILSDSPEVTREVLTPHREGKDLPPLEPGKFYGFSVDTGSACFVDEEAVVTGMPDESTWYDDLFESESEQSWFNLLDNNQIRSGIANIPLPLARDGSNIIIVHSGWGDGTFPIVGGYDARGALMAVHADFML